jgi:alpha-tubulin suppressor-like RCC1 family protein
MDPLEVSGAAQWQQLQAGWGHTCGLTLGGEMYCWGSNANGQVGDGTDIPRTSPTLVNGGMQFVEISVGYLHSCALALDGRAYCWGSNIYGEVGDSTHERRAEPTPVLGDHRFASIAAGGGPCHGHTCAVTTAGDTYCWGRNYQREITSSEVLLPYPVLLESDPGLVAFAIGGGAVCGLTADGALYCWGSGIYGQMGTGSTGSVEIPTAIRPDLAFASVSAGQYHTCAVTVDGASYCWGYNGEGQLGNGSNRLGWTVPVPVWR